MDDLFVLKFGGNAIRGKDDLARLSKEINVLKKEGARIVMVHGGGPEITDEMKKRGLSPRMVAGHRITDEDALDVASHVLERINGDVVTSLRDAGMDAEGVPGHTFIKCVRKAPIKAIEDGKETEVDLGLVGEVDSVDASPIMKMIEKDVVPVIYPICAGPDGPLNTNADTVAAWVAAAVGCREMIQITDVSGILMDVKDPSSKADVLTLDEIDGLIASGVISGGMIPKVEACRTAIDAGVPTVRMVNGKDRTIVSDLLKNKYIGTVITR